VPRLIEGRVNINVLLGFAFGVAAVIAMLAFAVFIPNPSSFSQWVFITVLALSAAGIGSVIPGILDLQLPYLKAGGALAMFAVVFLMKPAIVSSVSRVVPPEDSPNKAINSYLTSVDKNDLSGAWEQLDPEAKIGVARDKDAYKQAYDAGRTSLGAIAVRTSIGVQELQSPSGHPIGVYRAIGFRTKFADGSCRFEQVMVRGAEDRQWRVYEHNISPMTIPCG
jgi:hypothetical protein